MARRLVCTLDYMPIQIVRNELPRRVSKKVVSGIHSAIGDPAGLWSVDITSEVKANAWDIEVVGPDGFYWARRFSGGDRDADVVSEAIRSAIIEQAA
jgi:hypothetical protein